ncbi:MAG: hypothetical protein ACWA5U_11370 [bacterium]
MNAPIKISEDIAANLARLNEELGIEQSLALLAFALPHIRQHAEHLDQALATNNWQQAALYAHKALSSAHLYGSTALNVLLTQLKEGNQTIPAEVFQRALADEFMIVIASIEQWLATHYE